MGISKYKISPEHVNCRLDKFLSSRHLDITRSRIKKLIENGHVLVNGSVSKPGAILKPGWEITIEIPAPVPSDIEPENIPLNILFEDTDIIVIDKQPHLVMHPSPGHSGGTLVNALLNHCNDLSGIGGVTRPGIVHRLDKGTSGVLVAAKNNSAHAALSRQFSDHKIERVYLAGAKGETGKESGRIDKPLGRSRKDRKKIAVSEGGRAAVTNYTVLARRLGVSLLKLKPSTGRTHQLRVHMASIGHPILGDSMYGGGVRSVHMKDPEALTLLKALKRPALHAQRLGFTHPSTGEKMAFEAPPPDDLSDLFLWIKGKL